jgi:hypothetical protein
MSENQDLSELLQRALSDIDEVGGSERHLLRQVIGKDAYDGMMSRERSADLIDRWLNACGKAKPAATKALAIGIARHADRADLTDRIEREIGDAFEVEPEKARANRDHLERTPTSSEAKKHRAAVNQRTAGQRVSYQKPEGVSLALLAQSPGASRYIKAKAKQPPLARRLKNEKQQAR